MTDLARTIDAAWEDRAALGLDTGGEVRLWVDRALALLDAGEALDHAIAGATGQLQVLAFGGELRKRSVLGRAAASGGFHRGDRC